MDHAGGRLAVGAARAVVDGRGRDIDVAVDPAAGVLGSAGAAFLTTLLVGAILIALWPAATDRRMATVWEEPLDSFLWGLVGIGGVLVLSILLVISIVGILVVIPFLIAAYLAWAVGSTVAFLAIGDRLTDAFGTGDDDAGDGDRHDRHDDRDRHDGWGTRDERDDRDGGWGDDAEDTDPLAHRDGDRGWLWPLVLGASLNGGLVLSGLGGLVALGIGMVGFGALLTDTLG